MREDIFKFAEAICDLVFRPMVPFTPIRTELPDGRIRRESTGNMRYNATKFRKHGENAVQIYVHAGKGIVRHPPREGSAPYAVYTNEPWISPFWNGLKNPNEKWFERATAKVATELCALLDGSMEISREDET